MRYVWHQVGGKLVPGPSPRRCPKVLSVMADIEPYRATNGRIISSRSAHRRMLREGGYEELGNEWDAWMAANKAPEPTRPEVEHDIKEAIEMCRAGKGTYGERAAPEIEPLISIDDAIKVGA